MQFVYDVVNKQEKDSNGDMQVVMVMKKRLDANGKPVMIAKQPQLEPLFHYEEIQMYESDCERYKCGQLLNDKNIDFIVAFYTNIKTLVENESLNRNQETQIVLGSHVFSALDKYQYDRSTYDLVGPRTFLRDPTQKQSLLVRYDKVFMVVNERNFHWILVEVSYKKELGQISMRVFDSLGQTRQIQETTVLILLRKYFEADFMDLYRIKVKFREESMNTPTQSGGPDCGVFCCKFIEYLYLKRSEQFQQSEFSRKGIDDYRGFLGGIAIDVRTAFTEKKKYGRMQEDKKMLELSIDKQANQVSQSHKGGQMDIEINDEESKGFITFDDLHKIYAERILGIQLTHKSSKIDKSIIEGKIDNNILKEEKPNMNEKVAESKGIGIHLKEETHNKNYASKIQQRPSSSSSMVTSYKNTQAKQSTTNIKKVQSKMKY